MKYGKRSAPFASGLSFLGLTIVAATHVGYPLLVKLAARHARLAAPRDDGIEHSYIPKVAVLVPAYNEAQFIAHKIQDTLAQDYPRDSLEIIVVDDGSDDATADAAASVRDPRIRVITQTPRQGKSAALNRGVQEATSEIVVFTDANGSLDPGSLRAVAAPFNDPRVAVVSGRKRPVGHGAHGGGESSYWRYESALKDAEGVLGTVVGADGGIYAVRKSAYRPIPPHTYADDYWIPIDALSRGYLVRHAANACATESISQSKRDDFERRKRIAAGIWQVTLSHTDLAYPTHRWTAIAFICHRLMRTVVVPSLLPAIFLASWIAGRRGNWLMRVLLAGQIGAWSAAAAGAVWNFRIFAVPYQFAMSNIAAIFGGYRHLRRRQSGLWHRTERGDWHSRSTTHTEAREFVDLDAR